MRLGPDIVCLFPAISGIGGIQSSARIALEGLTKHLGASKIFALSFDRGQPQGQTPLMEPHIVTGSKLSAVFRALTIARSPAVILFWHIGLLKLLPFLPTRKAKIVLFVHGIDAWKQPSLPFKMLFRKVDVVLSNTMHTWERFVDCVPDAAHKRHHVIWLGLEETHPSPVESPAIPPSIVSVGRMDAAEDYKGHRELIVSWPLVLAQRPDAQLWLVGDGTGRSAMAKLVTTLDLSSHIRFFGEVSEEKKNALIIESMGLAMPSRAEGFGLVYLEAMRHGRPCLVSDMDAGREVVNPPEAGLSTTVKDGPAMANALIRLLTPGPEWNQWSARAKTRYETHFTAAHFQRRLLQTLQPFVNSR